MITIENLEKELKEKKLHSLYLLYGEETFLLETSLKKIKNLFGEAIKGINYIVIDETNSKELIPNLETPSFGYEKKLIIVKNTGLLKKEGKRKNAELVATREKISNYLKENIKTINNTCIVVFVEEEIDAKYELYKTIDKLGIVCQFDYQKPIQIEKRIKAICNAYKVEIEEFTIKYLIESLRK